VPARMVNEFVYCPRLAYLMWTQGEWTETGDTAEGKRVHGRVDRPSAPLPAPEALASDGESAADKIVSRSLTLSSQTLGVIAKLDFVEAEDGIVTPIDYKRGRRPHVAQGAYDPERIQVCLQALLLEENGYRVEEGAIWYAESGERRAHRAGRDIARRGACRRERAAAHRLAGPHPSAAEGQPEMPTLRATCRSAVAAGFRAPGLTTALPHSLESRYPVDWLSFFDIVNRTLQGFGRDRLAMPATPLERRHGLRDSPRGYRAGLCEASPPRPH
jgi:CRISPR-associated protein Cas4